MSTISTTTVKKGDRFESRRTGIIREVIGFTRKPDGVRRAKLQDVYGQAGTFAPKVTTAKVDGLTKNYVRA